MADNVVLAVSDDRGIRDMLELVLAEELSLHVDVAANGEEALALAGQGRPALILLDWSDAWPVRHAPDSRAVLSALRDHASIRNVPIVAITFGSEDGREALIAGCSEYLAKPFDIDELIAVVVRFLPRQLEMAS